MSINSGTAVVGHRLGPVVLLAGCAVDPARIAARVQRTLTLMQQEVVRTVRAYYQILAAIVLFVAVDVMHFFSAAEVAAKRALRDQNVLQNILAVCSRMIRAEFGDVPVYHLRAATPVGVALAGPELLAVALPEPHRLTLHASTTGCAVLGYRGRQSAAAFAHHGTLLVSVIAASNLTLSEGY